MVSQPILLNDFKRQWEVVGKEILAATEQVGKKGWYILGEEVAAFEAALAPYFSVKNAVGVANGMDALEIALRCLGIGENDQVLTTPLSAFATTLAILKVGAEPVYVDVDSAGLMDLSIVEQVLKTHKKIKCIIPVHLYGLAMNLDQLEWLQSHFSIPVIEDCAQSIGARYAGRQAGSIGRVAATSFYPTKNLGTLGDGGALLTSDNELTKKAKSIRNYGQSAHYVHDDFGLNSRLDELHAAILLKGFLPHLNDWNQKRKKIAELYLANIKNKNLSLLQVDKNVEPVWHLFPVLVSGSDRSSFQKFLSGQNIATGLHYPKLIQDQKALKDTGKYQVIGELTRANQFAQTEVSLPIHPFLEPQEIEHVIHVCNQWQP